MTNYRNSHVQLSVYFKSLSRSQDDARTSTAYVTNVCIIIMRLRSNKEIVRDGIPPRVGSGILAPDLSERFPAGSDEGLSARATRAADRTRLRDELARAEKSVTAKTNGSKEVPTQELSDVLNVQAQQGCQTPPAATQQEQPHRVEAVSSESSPPSSIDDGLYAGPELIHKSRNSNISKLTLTQKPKLAFPPSHDPIWGEINKELASGLPTVFNATVIRKLDITTLSEKFDSWLYGFFLDHFGEEVRSKNPPKSSPGKKLHHRGLEKLRRRKTDCKRARKALHKAGHVATPED